MIGFALLQNMRLGQKGKSLQTKGLFASFSYYKLRAGEHFVHNVFGLGSKGYGVGSVEEVFDEALMVLGMVGGWKTMGKKSKLVTRVGLHNSQCHGSAMTNIVKGNFSDAVLGHRTGKPPARRS